MEGWSTVRANSGWPASAGHLHGSDTLEALENALVELGTQLHRKLVSRCLT
jgi:hypothetical protein